MLFFRGTAGFVSVLVAFVVVAAVVAAAVAVAVAAAVAAAVAFATFCCKKLLCCFGVAAKGLCVFVAAVTVAFDVAVVV